MSCGVLPQKTAVSAVGPLKLTAANETFVNAVIGALGLCSLTCERPLASVMTSAVTVAALALARVAAASLCEAPSLVIAWFTASLAARLAEWKLRRRKWERLQRLALSSVSSPHRRASLESVFQYVLRIYGVGRVARFLRRAVARVRHALRLAWGTDDGMVHLTVPEVCEGEFMYTPLPNLVYVDLVWYVTAQRAAGLVMVGQEGQDGQDGIVTQTRASAAVETLPRSDRDGDGGVDTCVEFEHEGCRVLVALCLAKATDGSAPHKRSVELSAARSGGARVLRSFIAHVQMARRLAAGPEKAVWKPVVYHYHPHAGVSGSWKGSYVPNRKLFAHVAMRQQDKRALTADLDSFLASEELYHGMGLCWTRGYLLHGPPGCGKSSCVSAISGTYRLPIYSVNLREVSGDAELRAMFTSLPERVLVVLEDVDCMTDAVFSAREGSRGPPLASAAPGGSSGRVSLSGLLNVLDGIETGAGRVLVMTTNHKDVLDPALIRPGRCDVHLELGHCTAEHVDFLVSLYLGAEARQVLAESHDDLEQLLRVAPLTPAEVAKVLLPLTTANAAQRCPAAEQVRQLLCELRAVARATVKKEGNAVAAGAASHMPSPAIEALSKSSSTSSSTSTSTSTSSSSSFGSFCNLPTR